MGVLLFLPASLLVLLTAELGYESPGRLLRSWYTKLRRAGAVDEPRRDSYVASELREAVKELQAVKEQLGSTVALTAAPAHGSVGSASAVGAPMRTAGPARGGQLGAAAAATRSAAPELLHELQQAQGAPQVGQQQPSEATSEDLIRAALDDVGLEGILGERHESTRRESSEGKELLRQQRASAALRIHEQLSEEEVRRSAVRGRSPPISPPYPAFISPISPLYLAHISPVSPPHLPKVLRLAEDALPPETRPPVAGYLPLSARALGGRYPATSARRAPFLAVDEEVDEL